MGNKNNIYLSIQKQAERYDVNEFWDMYCNCLARVLTPKIRNKHLLEMGCGELVMSKIFVKHASQFDIVDAAKTFVENAQRILPKKVHIYHSLFEEFNPLGQYEAIVFTNTLHHIYHPTDLLRRIKGWLSKDGRLYITAPNILSLHRRLGVKMGIINSFEEESERNIMFNQPGRYTLDSLKKMCISCGYRVNESFCFFLKPFSYDQMNSLKLSQDAIDALFHLGKEYPDIANSLYVDLSPQDTSI